MGRIIVLIAVVLIVSIAIFWFAGTLMISLPDAKENRERAKSFYNDLRVQYETNDGRPFEMNYTYDMKTNTGFFSGGAYTGADCWERYIRDAWSNQEILSVSLCGGEEITEEKLEILEEFWKKHQEIFNK